MDSKYVRTTVDNLLAELERNPAIGRRMSPSFVSRYGRPLGLGIALGVSGAVGCSGSSEESKGNPDALYSAVDAYGIAGDRPLDRQSDLLPVFGDAYGMAMPDRPADSDVRPLDGGSVDAYGIREVAVDTRDVLPLLGDVYGDLYGISNPDRPTDTRDALPGMVDAYGMTPDRPVDTQDAQPLSVEAGRETLGE